MIDITGLREDKRPQSSTIVYALLDRLEAAEKERDAMRAKIEQMEKQEPVAYGTWDTQLGRTSRMMMVRLGNGQDGCRVPLYALPGAQAQPAPTIAEQDQSNAEEAIRAIYGTAPTPLKT